MANMTKTEWQKILDDANQRASAWKARREGDISDIYATAASVLQERYPAGFGLTDFKKAVKIIEGGRNIGYEIAIGRI